MNDKPTPLDLEDGYYSAAELNIVRQARQLKEERDTAQHEASGLRRELERLERRIWPNGERG